jgi:hypothetical protein
MRNASTVSCPPGTAKSDDGKEWKAAELEKLVQMGIWPHLGCCRNRFVDVHPMEQRFWHGTVTEVLCRDCRHRKNVREKMPAWMRMKERTQYTLCAHLKAFAKWSRGPQALCSRQLRRCNELLQEHLTPALDHHWKVLGVIADGQPLPTVEAAVNLGVHPVSHVRYFAHFISVLLPGKSIVRTWLLGFKHTHRQTSDRLHKAMIWNQQFKYTQLDEMLESFEKGSRFVFCLTKGSHLEHNKRGKVRFSSSGTRTLSNCHEILPVADKSHHQAPQALEDFWQRMKEIRGLKADCEESLEDRLHRVANEVKCCEYWSVFPRGRLATLASLLNRGE